MNYEPAWYVVENGKSIGPLTSAEMKEKIQSKDLKPLDLIYREGEDRWVCAKNAKEFQNLFDDSNNQLKIKPADWVVLKKRKESAGYSQLGPFDQEQLVKMLQSGELEYSDYCWRSGYDDWIKVSKAIEDSQTDPFVKIKTKDSETERFENISEDELLKNVIWKNEQVDLKFEDKLEDPNIIEIKLEKNENKELIENLQDSSKQINDNPELQDDADTWVGEVKSFEKVQSESVKIKKVEKSISPLSKTRSDNDSDRGPHSTINLLFQFLLKYKLHFFYALIVSSAALGVIYFLFPKDFSDLSLTNQKVSQPVVENKSTNELNKSDVSQKKTLNISEPKKIEQIIKKEPNIKAPTKLTFKIDSWTDKNKSILVSSNGKGFDVEVELIGEPGKILNKKYFEKSYKFSSKNNNEKDEFEISLNRYNLVSGTFKITISSNSLIEKKYFFAGKRDSDFKKSLYFWNKKISGQHQSEKFELYNLWVKMNEAELQILDSLGKYQMDRSKWNQFYKIWIKKFANINVNKTRRSLSKSNNGNLYDNHFKKLGAIHSQIMSASKTVHKKIDGRSTIVATELTDLNNVLKEYGVIISNLSLW